MDIMDHRQIQTAITKNGDLRDRSGTRCALRSLPGPKQTLFARVRSSPSTVSSCDVQLVRYILCTTNLVA